MGPRAALGGPGGSCPPLGFDPLSIQPLASHYTKCAILAHIITCVEGVMLLLKVHSLLFCHFVFMCHLSGQV
jgi:hypothetical protein